MSYSVADVPANNEASSNNDSADDEHSALLHSPTANYLSVNSDTPVPSNSVEHSPTPTTAAADSGVV